jgi:hypothetical protein
LAAEAERKPTVFEVRQVYSDIAELARHASADSLIEALAPQHLDAFAWFVAQTNRTRLAGVLLQRGDTVRAHRLLAHALERATRAIDDEGSDHSAERLEIAAIHALRGERDVAIQWVRRAYDAGERGHRLLELSPAFAGIREMPEFREIMRLMEADVARMRRNAASRSELL